jgi:hypothetical protein
MYHEKRLRFRLRLRKERAQIDFFAVWIVYEIQLISILVVDSSLKVYPQIFLPGKYRRLSSFLIFSTLLLLLCTGNTFAQDNTLYLMPDIPEANQLNPALFKLCRIYVELPVISSVKVNIRNSGFGFHDVIQKGTGTQSNTYLVNLQSVESRLKGINYSQIETDINLLGFGFGYKEWYFTFGISNHTDLLLSYPHDVVLMRDDYLNPTNPSRSLINLNRLEGEATLWNSIGVSAAKEIKEGLRVGVRLQYLQGMANAVSRGSELVVTPFGSPLSLQVMMKYRINSSFPLNIRYSPNGLVHSVNFDNSLNNIAGDFIFNGNRGAAIDAGFVYDKDEITQISGSITDLGFIRWKKNTNIFSATGDYLFNATDLAIFQIKPSAIDLVRALKDSISKSVGRSTRTYYTLVPIKIFGGITRLLLPGLRAGAMTRIEIYDLHIMPSLSLSMNYTPVPLIAASLSYTIMNNKFNQVGAGIAVGNHLAQFYLITDNIPLRFTKDINSPLFWPYNARMLSLRFGLNLLFGCNLKENKFRLKNRRDLCPAYW